LKVFFTKIYKMKTFLSFIFGSLFLLTACQQKSSYVPKGLHKLSPEELIKRAENHSLTEEERPITKNDNGEIILIDTIQNFEDLASDAYVDNTGKIVEVVFRKATKEDKELRSKIISIQNETIDVRIVEIDCSDKQNILQQVYEKDQTGGRKSINKKIDHENLEIVSSLLEKCGMPNKDELSNQQYNAIWLVIQHSGRNDYAKKYLPMFELAAEKGDFDWGAIALLKDRSLMYDGKPQIYGSQISNGKLWELTEPEYVNKRRKKMGLEPIEDYLKRFDIVFEIPQKE